MCDKDGCTRDPVGTIQWQESEREYCQLHMRKARAQFPELINGVELI